MTKDGSQTIRNTYVYDTAGNLTATVDSQGNTSHLEYDENGRVLAM